MAIRRAFQPALLLLALFIGACPPLCIQNTFASAAQDQVPLRILDLSSEIPAMIPPSKQDYELPTDDPEHKRLDIQHAVWKLMLSNGQSDADGLFPQEVANAIEEHLAQTSAPLIMDLGSGSGAWAIDMAHKFDSANIIGLDQALPTSDPDLPNLSFVKKDIMEGLEEYEGRFDFVHSRCVVGHMNDRHAFLKIILKILKPGGLLILSDGNLGVFDPANAKRVTEDTPAINNDTLPGVIKSHSELDIGRGLWMDWWCEKTVGSMLSRTQDPGHAGGDKLQWQIDQLPAFTLIKEGVREYFSPVKSVTNKARSVSEDKNSAMDLETLSSKNIINFLNSSRPILVGDGHDEKDIDFWQKMAREDVENAAYGWALKWNVVIAKKQV